MNPDGSARDRLASIASLTGTPPALDPAALPGDPVELFLTWLDQAVAAGAPEPRAMTLSGTPAERSSRAASTASVAMTR